jgi:hypothetical protein
MSQYDHVSGKYEDSGCAKIGYFIAFLILALVMTQCINEPSKFDSSSYQDNQ